MEKFKKPYLDTEKKLFNELSQEKRNERISEIGSEEGAVQQYGYELALQSMDREEELISPEEKESEIYKKLEKAAQNVLKCLDIKYDSEKKKGQNLVLVTDEGVPPIVRQSFIEQSRLSVQKDLRVVMSKKPEQLAESLGESIGQKLISADKAILLTSMSRTHSEESREALAGLSKNLKVASLQKRRKQERDSMFVGKTSIFSITRANNLELLTEGAAMEDVEKMWERIDKFLAKFKDAKKAFIETEKGTNLEIQIKKGTIAAESGKLSEPGNVANFPFGEVGCVPSWEGTNGILVVDGVGGKAGATTNEGYIKEPLKFFIENGVVTKIEGGKEADDFWEYLKQVQSKYCEQNPKGKGNAFKLAEFAFGMNSSAWRETESGKKLPPTQLEAEKALGTIHIAVGNNALLLGLGGFGSDDSEYNDIKFHSDQVILDPTITIENDKGEKINLMSKGELKL